MEAVRERLWVKTDVGGVARYENDYYHQVSQDVENVPGNPWFICTLWLAQWHIATARNMADLQPALDILDWAAAHAMPSGVMAEQVHPYTNAPLSVSPLTWSHATLVMAVREYLARRAAM
jgi:glucoamylase